jgi:hypothetical protein
LVFLFKNLCKKIASSSFLVNAMTMTTNEAVVGGGFAVANY